MGLHKNAAHRAREGVTAKNRRKERAKVHRAVKGHLAKLQRPAPPPSLRDDPPLPVAEPVPVGTQTTIAPVTPADVAPKADRAAGMVQFRILASELEELRTATRSRPDDGPREVIKAALTIIRILAR